MLVIILINVASDTRGEADGSDDFISPRIPPGRASAGSTPRTPSRFEGSHFFGKDFEVMKEAMRESQRNTLGKYYLFV